MENFDFNAEIEKHYNIKRFIIISDTHFGVRSNSVEWMEIQQDYFYNWFIPLLKKNFKSGDALIHTGDVFDSRQSLNLKVMNIALEIFDSISKIMPVYIICGNHDIYHKNTNTVNSLKPFKYIQNIFVYEKPIILEVNNGKTRLLLMPWIETKENQQLIIDNNSSDYLFCHTDIKGLKFNSYTKIEEGIDINKVNKFKKVYSGHIHYTQTIKNIQMVGCPYQLTRGDIGNKKYVWYIDFETDKEIRIENDYSPKFLRLKLEDVLEMRYGKLKKMFENNFVDILVNSNSLISFPFNLFLELFEDVHYRKINYIIATENDNEIELDDKDDQENNELDILNLINIYIDNLSYKDNIKNKLKNISKKIYYKISKEKTEK